MATTRSFNAMLNEYLPLALLKEELQKRDYLLSNVEKDNTWKGGNLIIPFKGAGASSLAYGSLSASTDIAEDSFVRGSIGTQPEVWASMIFNERDLMEHDKLSEQNFLKLLPDTIDDMMDRFKNVVSVNLLNGAHTATVLITGDSSGNITIDRPERFDIGQKVIVDDDDSSPTSGFVKTININTGVLNLVTARGGATGVDLSGYSTGQNAKLFEDGAQSASFTSLKSQLLPASAGGSSTLFGQTKATYPYLQAIWADGSSNGLAITAVNILDKIFDHLTTVRKLGKGRPTDIVMSYKNLGSVLKILETTKGPFNVVPMSQKTAPYGWTEIMVGSVTSQPLKLVAVQEMDDDWIAYLDMRGLMFYSNGFFRRRKSPDGQEYFPIRNTTGYQYIVDTALFGDLACYRPSYQGVISGISY